MNTTDKLGIAFLSLVVIGSVAAVASVTVPMLKTALKTTDKGSPDPESIPVTGVTLAQDRAVTCTATPRWSFHLRPNQREDWEGATEYPAGETCIVLERGELTRRGATIYRVRVNRTAQEGWIYLYGFELSGECAGQSVEPPRQTAMTEREIQQLSGQAQQRGPLAGDPNAIARVPPVIFTGNA